LQGISAHLFRQGAGHVGFNQTGCDGITGDVATAHFEGDRAGEAHQCGFGRHIVCLPDIACQAHDRADVDDASPSLAQHRLEGSTRCHKGAPQVDLQHPIPVLVLHAQQQGIARNAGVVDEDIESFPAFQQRFDGFFDGAGVCHIGGDGDGFTARFLNLLGDLLGVRLRAAKCCHACACSGKGTRNCLPDAASCARY
jgi:hypothetical protein